ncbi:hypothetical protein KAR48_03950 [bacterium]|nr:hypothetical protein [bacterium]
MKRLGIFFIGWMLFCIPLSARGQATLLSVKQGQAGERSWVVLTFDQRIIWSGLSRPNAGRISLYMMGSPGLLEGKEWTLGDIMGPSVSVRRIEGQTSVFSIDCVFDADFPFAVLRRPRHLIISFDDDRFVKQAFDDAAINVSATPGMVSGFNTDHENGQALHSMEFDGSYNWIAFMQPSSNVGAFFIDGAGIGISQTERIVSESDLTKMQLFPVPDRRALKAVFYFEAQSSYSVVRKSRELILQTTSRPIQQTLAMVEENRAELDLSLFEEKDGDVISTDRSYQTDTMDLQNTLEIPTTTKKEVKVIEPIKKENDDKNDDDWKALERFRANVESNVKEPVVKTNLVANDVKSNTQTITEGHDWKIPWSTVVSFRFDGTPLRDALRTVSRANSINMVIGSSVQGEVTMNLQSVTLRQTLNMLVHTNDCEYVADEGIITVKAVKKEYTGGMITRVFRLKYAEADNLAPVIKQIVANDSLVQVYYPEFLNYNNAGKQRQEANKVAIQGVRRSSVLVVTGRPEDMKEVIRVINELDTRPRQIMIHSKLIEMSPTNTNELGVNWDKTLTMALNQVDILEGGEKTNFSALNSAPDKGGSMNLGHLTASKFQAVIDFLEEQTETKLKSNPTLMATDNHEASISVGTTVPVPKIQRGFGGQQDMVTFDYKEVNIQLNVTPHITENNEITMFVNPVIEEISGWVEYQGNQAPITDKRAVNTIVAVKNGETVVIGGLVKSQKVRTLKKVWLLGSIPLIGKLFQHEKLEEKQTDLMIFITPTIIEPGI